MIKSKTVQKTILVDETDDIECNKCGHSISLDKENPEMVKGCYGKMKFGYGSKRDLTNLKFHLCDDCADEIVSTFVHPCEVEEVKELL